MSAEVYRDPWGIPHLRAGSARELAHAQGRNAARDRAWQIESERHRGLGTTAAFLGPEGAGWDTFARRARIDDTARRCFESLDPSTADWVRAYVDGVNAGLADGARRAPEFAATGLVPGRWRPWTPLALWLSHHILFAGFPTKLWREETARRLGAGSVELFATDGPGTSGSNGWLVPGEMTATGAALIAGDPHRFIEDPGIYQQIHLACPDYDVVGLAVPGVPGIAHFGHTGDVAWAITNAMADYQDLYAERLRRRGGRVEALGPDGWRPAESHQETVEVAGAEPVVIEVIETERGPVVSGGPGGAGAVEAAPEEGPGASGAAVSLRCPPRAYADLGFAALPALLRARTVADVDRAFDHWAEPVNVVQAADTRGGLLHRVAGVVPDRSRENSLRIVPAWEPGHEWKGTRRPMPREPVEGIAVMANQRGLAAPLGVEFAPPHRAERIRQLLAEHGRAWTAGDMAAVHTDTHLASAGPLLDRLAALDGLGPAAACLRDRLLRWDRRMDADSADAAAYAAVRSAVVRRLAAHPALAALAGLAGDSPYPEVFRPWLALAPRIAHALERVLAEGPVPDRELPALLAAALEEAATEPAGGGPRTAAGNGGAAEPGAVDTGAAAGNDGAAGPEPSGAGAMAGNGGAAGPEPGGTGAESVPGGSGPAGAGAPGAPGAAVWGDTHRLAPWHALSGASAEREEWPALSGDHDCVLATSSVPGVTDLSARGPAARYVWDLARREDSLWVVPFGASGVPGDPHHRDQLPLWLKGELIPVITDWTRLTEERDDL